MTVAAARHHQALSVVINHFGLAVHDILLGTLLVTYIDVLAVLHGKGFHNLVILRSKNLTIDHQVGHFGSIATLSWVITFRAAGKHARCKYNTHHNDA